ncbi:MAG: glycosyltransferase family 2 protein [Candidatus Micrarchaeia archaeon]
MKTVVLIPAYNERKNISEVVTAVRKTVRNVLVVDDGSSDDTSKQAEVAGAKVLALPVNMGVGFATRFGADYAFEKLKANVVITLDADGQHPVSAVPLLLRAISKGHDVVLAVRTKERKNMPFVKRFGNGFLTFVVNVVYGTSFADTQSGLKAFTSKAYRKLNLTSNDYSICSEFASEIALKRLKYKEVPIDSLYDSWTKVKGTDIFTGVNIFLMTIFWKVFKWDSNSKQ